MSSGDGLFLIYILDFRLNASEYVPLRSLNKSILLKDNKNKEIWIVHSSNLIKKKELR